MVNKAITDVMDHEDKDEILVKLLSDVPIKDINQWLSAKYKGQRELIIPQKSLSIFKSEYLDLYSKMREDLLRTKINLASQTEEIQQEISGNAAYQKKLAEITDKELDIKTIVQKLVVMIEHRADQLFTDMQENPRNMKMDATLIKWLNLLLETLAKFDLISNGSPEQTTINNNINIQVVDNHINMVYGVIREILSQLDNETSLLFTELFSKRLMELKEQENVVIPMEKRLEATYKIQDQLEKKLDA